MRNLNLGKNMLEQKKKKKKIVRFRRSGFGKVVDQGNHRRIFAVFSEGVR